MNKHKLPGKEEWSGQRRPATRSAGFHSHKDATGSHYIRYLLDNPYDLDTNERMKLTFNIPSSDGWIGFGGYFWHTGEISVGMTSIGKKTLKTYPPGLWSKFGSMWKTGPDTLVEVGIQATKPSSICFMDLASGKISHPHTSVMLG